MPRARGSVRAWAAGLAVAAALGALVGSGLSGAFDGDGSSGDVQPMVERYAAQKHSDVTVRTLGGSLTVSARSLNASADIVLDRDSRMDGPPAPLPHMPGAKISPLSDYFDVAIRPAGASRGLVGGHWDPPLKLVVDLPAAAVSVPDGELIACYYFTGSSGHAWRPIPSIGSRRRLTLKERDGFYVTGEGARRKVQILSRHATIFAIFRMS